MKTRIRTLALLLAFLLALPLADGMAYATGSIGLEGLGETVTEAQLEDAACFLMDPMAIPQWS